MSTQNKNTEIQPAPKGVVRFNVAGEEVELSQAIVRAYLTNEPTVTNEEVGFFIAWCKMQKLNPFLKEAYLIKFKGSPAQIVTGKEAFTKRAEANEDYEGMVSGVIVERDGETIELEGCYYKSTDVLTGAWAKVFRKGRKFPTVSKVRLEDYDQKQSIWLKKKGTMIVKVAEVQALRAAFPSQLGAMYSTEEMGVQDIPFVDVSDMVASAVAVEANSESLNTESNGNTGVPESTVIEPLINNAQGGQKPTNAGESKSSLFQ